MWKNLGTYSYVLESLHHMAGLLPTGVLVQNLGSYAEMSTEPNETLQ